MKQLILNNKLKREVIKFAFLPTRLFDNRTIWLKKYKSIEICRHLVDKQTLKYMPAYAWEQIKKERV